MTRLGPQGLDLAQRPYVAHPFSDKCRLNTAKLSKIKERKPTEKNLFNFLLAEIKECIRCKFPFNDVMHMSGTLKNARI